MHTQPYLRHRVLKPGKCDCEKRSDEAISNPWDANVMRLLRYARNDMAAEGAFPRKK